jgi:hypothetical protein
VPPWPVMRAGSGCSSAALSEIHIAHRTAVDHTCRLGSIGHVNRSSSSCSRAARRSSPSNSLLTPLCSPARGGRNGQLQRTRRAASSSSRRHGDRRVQFCPWPGASTDVSSGVVTTCRHSLADDRASPGGRQLAPFRSLWDKTGLTSQKCPHCTGLTSNSDDGHHVVSDCTHHILAGQRTHRHNRICYLICEAIRAAYHANHWHVNVDAGTRFRPGDWNNREIMSPSVLPDDAHEHLPTNNAQPMESTSQDQPSAATTARQPEKQRCTIPLWALPDNTFLPDKHLVCQLRQAPPSLVSGLPVSQL